MIPLPPVLGAGTCYLNGGVMNVTLMTAGVLRVGSVVKGVNVTPGTVITGLLSGRGQQGAYSISPTQTFPFAVFFTAESAQAPYIGAPSQQTVTSGFASLLLDLVNWDLCVDINGNIAVCLDPYRAAQDVACQERLFQGEAYYDTAAGIPYATQVLGHTPPLGLLKQLWVNTALTVAGVASAVAYVTKVSGRVVTGQVQITDAYGTVQVITTGPSSVSNP